MLLQNSNLQVSITAAGLNAVMLPGGQQVLLPTSGLALYNAPTGFDPKTNPFGYAISDPPIGTLKSSSVAGNPSQAQVSHQYPNLSATYLYTLNGSNIEVDIQITNSGPEFHGLTFAGPTAVFSSTTPKGNLHTWAADYLFNNCPAFYHPSVETPLQLAYAYDANYAVAIHSKSHALVPGMFNATPGQLISGQGTFPIMLFIDCVVPANSTYPVSLTIRVTPQTDIPTIAASYVSDYQVINGPQRYAPNDLPVIQCAPLSGSPPTPDNPFGYSPARRLDVAADIPAFLAMFAPMANLAQSVIFWQGQGLTDCEYSPNFDIFPPTVAANVPAIISGLKALDIGYGMLARPSSIVEQATFTTDEIVELDGDDANQVAALLQRFANVKTMGATSFYFDSFGNDLNSYKIMKQIWAALGPSVQTWSEYMTDILLPYSGQYCQLTDNSGGTTWYGPETMQIFRMLQPKSGVVALWSAAVDSTTNMPPLTSDWYGQHKLTPMVNDWLCAQWKLLVASLVGTYMVDGAWK